MIECERLEKKDCESQISMRLKYDQIGSLIWNQSTTLKSLVKKQIECGLEIVGDGHRGRKKWQMDFWAGFSGLDCVEIESGHVYQSYNTMTALLRIIGKISFPSSHPAIAEFVEVMKIADDEGVMAKAIVPAPAWLLSIIVNETEWRNYYDSHEAIKSDIEQAYKDMISAFYNAGCRFIQFDDYSWAPLMSDRGIKEMLQGGIDAIEYLEMITDIDSAVIDVIPKDMVCALYVARNAYEQAFRQAGDYSFVAPKLFGNVNADIFYIELNTDTANDYEIFKYLSDDKKVMLGIVSPADAFSDRLPFINENIRAAQRYVQIDRMGITFNRGINAERAILPEDVQWRILTCTRKCVESAFDMQ